MKKSFYLLFAVFSVVVGLAVSDTNANTNEGVTHLWNEFQFVGLHGGAYDIGERGDSQNSLFAGINGFYHTYLEHSRSGGAFAHFNSLGILGTLNYHFQSENITLSGFITSGYYPSKDTLLQWGTGLAYSDNFGTGLSAITHIGYAYHAEYAFSFFAQADYFPEIGSIQYLIGVSLGFGSLKSYQ